MKIQESIQNDTKIFNFLNILILHVILNHSRSFKVKMLCEILIFVFKRNIIIFKKIEKNKLFISCCVMYPSWNLNTTLNPFV